MYNITPFGSMKTTKEKRPRTASIRERSIYVYLPGVEMVKQWKNMADQSGMSISKFVIEHVNNSLQQEQNKESYESRSELLDEIRTSKEENKEQCKKIKMLDTLVDRLESEVRSYRLKPFIEEDFSGVRKYELELINLFKKRKDIRKEDLLDHLGINPMDTNVVKSIKKQIDNLEQYGLLKDIGGKWRWKP